MLSSWTKRILGAAAVLIALCCATPAWAQTGGLTGNCKGEKGEVLVGYPVIIERQDIRAQYKTKTDKHGEFIYIGLSPGDYKITLNDPNGHTLFYINHHVGIGDPTEVDFDLAKERARSAAEQKANPEMQRQLEEQAKDQKQFAGLKQLFDQGQELYGAGKYPEAAAAFEQAVPLAKDAKNQAVVLSRLADSYGKAKQYDKAAEAYQKAIAAKPDDATFYNNLGDIYASMGKTADAQGAFQKAAEIDPPGASKYYFNLGAIMYNQGKMDEAAAAFDKAVKVDPKNAAAYALEARALMGKLTMGSDGKVIAPPGTQDLIETYLKLDPTGTYAQEMQSDLQVIQGSVETQYKKKKK